MKYKKKKVNNKQNYQNGNIQQIILFFFFLRFFLPINYHLKQVHNQYNMFLVQSSSTGKCVLKQETSMMLYPCCTFFCFQVNTEFKIGVALKHQGAMQSFFSLTSAPIYLCYTSVYLFPQIITFGSFASPLRTIQKHDTCFLTCKNYSSAAALGSSWQMMHFPPVDHFKKCASFTGHQSLWQLVFIWKNELNHQYTNSNFISPPLLMHRRKTNARASLWLALGCFFLNQWHPTRCQCRIMPALCSNGETVINFKVPQWLEFFQAVRACISR